MLKKKKSTGEKTKADKCREIRKRKEEIELGIIDLEEVMFHLRRIEKISPETPFQKAMIEALLGMSKLYQLYLNDFAVYLDARLEKERKQK